MAELTLNTPRNRGLLYGLITLSSMVMFGNVAEICDLLDFCPPRLAVIIGFGVVSAVVSGTMFLALLIGIEFFQNIELFMAVLLLVLNSVSVGIISSVRTGLRNSVAVSFAWIAEILAFILVFLGLAMKLNLFTKKETVTETESRSDLESGSQRDEEVPENEHMEQVGELPEELRNESTSSPEKESQGSQ